MQENSPNSPQAANKDILHYKDPLFAFTRTPALFSASSSLIIHPQNLSQNETKTTKKSPVGDFSFNNLIVQLIHRQVCESLC
jgi:hypothetical protein